MINRYEYENILCNVHRTAVKITKAIRSTIVKITNNTVDQMITLCILQVGIEYCIKLNGILKHYEHVMDLSVDIIPVLDLEQDSTTDETLREHYMHHFSHTGRMGVIVCIGNFYHRDILESYFDLEPVSIYSILSTVKFACEQIISVEENYRNAGGLYENIRVRENMFYLLTQARNLIERIQKIFITYDKDICQMRG